MTAGPVSEAGGTRYLRLAGGSLGLLRLRGPATNDAPRLLCFPFGGAGPQVFTGLADHLPAEWGVAAVDPPGHVRTTGELLHSVPEMVDYYIEHLPPPML